MIRARFFVAGTPTTQGSKRIVQPKGHRRPMLLEQTSKKLGPWRAAVEAGAMLARQRCGTVVGPVTVSLSFYFAPPKRARNCYPSPDLDKLVRAVFDGLVRGQLLGDDRQVIAVTAQKAWASDPGRVGCAVTVYEVVTIPVAVARGTGAPRPRPAPADGAPPPAAAPAASLAGRAGRGRGSGTAR